MTQTSISIVIAVWRKTDALEACLRALAPQLDDAVEVLIVSSASLDGILDAYPHFRHLTAPKNRLVPQLWGMAMAAARNELVAITTAQFIPASDWIQQIRQGFSAPDIQGIGGTIEPPVGRPLVDWAIYFQRYSTYLGWNAPRTSPDLPGDNAAYRRSALQQHPQFFDIGFWEPEFHRLVMADGGILSWWPQMRVRQQGGFGLGRFMRQRFSHAVRFGRSRAAGRGAAYRLAAAVLSPLVPIIFGTKITRRVLRHKQHVAMFLASAPLLACFLMVWAMGEMLGYLSTAPKSQPSLFSRNGVSA